MKTGFGIKVNDFLWKLFFDKNITFHKIREISYF